MVSGACHGDKSQFAQKATNQFQNLRKPSSTYELEDVAISKLNKLYKSFIFLTSLSSICSIFCPRMIQYEFPVDNNRVFSAHSIQQHTIHKKQKLD
jgi:hypothetical protein